MPQGSESNSTQAATGNRIRLFHAIEFFQHPSHLTPTPTTSLRPRRPPGMAEVPVMQGAITGPPYILYSAAPAHDLQGWRKCWNCQEQFQCPAPAAYRTSCTCAAPAHDLQGWRKCWNCQEQFQCPAPAATARDGGSAGNAGSNYRPSVHPVHKKGARRRLCA